MNFKTTVISSSVSSPAVRTKASRPVASRLPLSGVSAERRQLQRCRSRRQEAHSNLGLRICDCGIEISASLPRLLQSQFTRSSCDRMNCSTPASTKNSTSLRSRRIWSRTLGIPRAEDERGQTAGCHHWLASTLSQWAAMARSISSATAGVNEPKDCSSAGNTGFQGWIVGTTEENG